MLYTICSICKVEVNIILSRINRITMNLILKVSRFFNDLQVNALKIVKEDPTDIYIYIYIYIYI